MGKRHTNQEWQTLIEQSESSSLSTLAFCKLNELNPSTFYAKRQQLKKANISQGFVLHIPEQSDHRFRDYPDIHSVLIRTPFPG